MPTLTLGQLAASFAILFLLFRGLERLRPKAERTPLWRKGLLTDLAYWVFNPLVADGVIRVVALLVLALIALALFGRVERAEILQGFGPLGRLPLVAQVVAMLIIMDFFGYWTHRVFHGRPRLWRFHAIHHAPTTLDWLSAARVHPVNELAGRLVALTPLLLAGFKLDALAWSGPIFGLNALLLHANLDWDYGPLRAVVASPRFHRWHHASDADAQGKNLAGLFPIWDILFGTYYMPRDRLPRTFGTDTPVPTGFLAQLLYPFRK